jgi:hypothetical protein
MENKGPTITILPSGFFRFPCPLTNAALDGLIDVDLGEWLIDGKKERAVLRIEGLELPKLIEAVASRDGREKGFGAAITVFIAANPDGK